MSTRPEIPSQRIELTYFREELTSIKSKTEKKSVEAAEQKELKIAITKTPEAPVPLVAETYTEAKIDLKPEGNSSEDGGTLENYYLKVREEIKSALEKHGKRFTREGEVYVKFIISKDGALKELALYKNSTRGASSLEAIAIKSIKEASPFPPFDDGINKAELPFKVPIRFALQP